MAAITLNDGTYIYSQDTAVDYFRSLGIDDETMHDLIMMAEPDYRFFIENSGEYVRRSEIDDWEKIADGYYNAYYNTKDEIEAMCEKFLSGRKITKADFVEWLSLTLERGLEY